MSQSLSVPLSPAQNSKVEFVPCGVAHLSDL